MAIVAGLLLNDKWLITAGLIVSNGLNVASLFRNKGGDSVCASSTTTVLLVLFYPRLPAFYISSSYCNSVSTSAYTLVPPGDIENPRQLHQLEAFDFLFNNSFLNLVLTSQFFPGCRVFIGCELTSRGPNVTSVGDNNDVDDDHSWFISSQKWEWLILAPETYRIWRKHYISRISVRNTGRLRSRDDATNSFSMIEKLYDLVLDWLAHLLKWLWRSGPSFHHTGESWCSSATLRNSAFRHTRASDCLDLILYRRPSKDRDAVLLSLIHFHYLFLQPLIEYTILVPYKSIS
ncbi:hypothetical protein DINM_006918 [Dirofilaria immitis]|nr:hypothetical protein [Dirofilaria immitis]